MAHPRQPRESRAADDVDRYVDEVTVTEIAAGRGRAAIAVGLAAAVTEIVDGLDCAVDLPTREHRLAHAIGREPRVDRPIVAQAVERNVETTGIGGGDDRRHDRLADLDRDR